MGEATTTMYIYFITDGEAIKIGKTNNVKNRLRVLQTAQPRELKCVKVIECEEDNVDRVEQSLHTKFKKAHIRGEWFDFTEDIKSYLGCAAFPVYKEREIVNKNDQLIEELREKIKNTEAQCDFWKGQAEFYSEQFSKMLHIFGDAQKLYSDKQKLYSDLQDEYFDLRQKMREVVKQPSWKNKRCMKSFIYHVVLGLG